MKVLRTLLITAIATSLTAVTFASEWMTDYKAALSLSKKTGKPILADFTGSDWCGWCIKLHKEVFDKPEFMSWAKKNVILLELDYPNQKPQTAAIKKQNAELAKKYAIQGYPTILFLNHKGDKLGEYGYAEGGPAKWTKAAEAMLKQK